MNQNDKQALADAVDTLITDADAAALFKQLAGVYDLARKNVPVRLVGRAAVLNPLLVLWLEDEDAAGLGPVGDGDYMRRAYMRELMAQKRERGRRLVDLENRLRADNDKLKGTQRMDFERLHANRWYEVKKEREAAARAKFDRRLSTDELAEIATNLWTDVDSELDAFEVFVEKEERQPLSKRSARGFKFLLHPKKG